MHDPSAALQKALVARLKSQVPLCASRVFDRTPAKAVFPFLEIGAAQSVSDDAGCIDGAECTFTLHIWSRAVGAVECRRIADQVASALQDWTPDLETDGFVCVDLACTGIQTLADPDGLTSHGIITITAQTERA